MNREPFGEGEWYHCYTRGVDKRKTFLLRDDYRRFVQTMYVANSKSPIHRSDLWYMSHDDFFALPRGESLVAIGGYCIMPNHFHLILQETTEGGISRFMQKIGISYTMYFNEKNERVGNLFVKPFRSKHIPTDSYLRKVIQYIHLNPAEMFETEWKKGRVKQREQLERALRSYQYSSLPFYAGYSRPENALLDSEACDVLQDGLPELSTIIDEAIEYYKEIGES